MQKRKQNIGLFVIYFDSVFHNQTSTAVRKNFVICLQCCYGFIHFIFSQFQLGFEQKTTDLIQFLFLGYSLAEGSRNTFAPEAKVSWNFRSKFQKLHHPQVGQIILLLKLQQWTQNMQAHIHIEMGSDNVTMEITGFCL